MEDDDQYLELALEAPFYLDKKGPQRIVKVLGPNLKEYLSSDRHCADVRIEDEQGVRVMRGVALNYKTPTDADAQLFAEDLPEPYVGDLVPYFGRRLRFHFL